MVEIFLSSTVRLWWLREEYWDIFIDGCGMYLSNDENFSHSPLNRRLVCSSKEVARFRLQRVDVKLKSEVSNLPYLNRALTHLSWLVACSMASAGFAACMGGKSPWLSDWCFQLLSDLLSITWDCPTGWNDIILSFHCFIYISLARPQRLALVGLPFFQLWIFLEIYCH